MSVVYEAPYMDFPAWDQIPKVELKHTGWLTPCPVQAWAQLCHDADYLYVRMEAQEANVRATLQDPLDQVCNDSCMEFFLAPDGEDDRYLNFEWNPLGNLYLGFGAARPTRVRQIVKKPWELFAPMTFRSEGGWGIRYRIPKTFLTMYYPNLDFTKPMACNFYKCGDETETPHYLSWSPMTCETPNFHRRGDFGTLLLK